MRKSIIDMVLATDMKQHFAIHSMFQAKMQLNGAGGPTSGNGSGGRPLRGTQPSTSSDGHRVVDEDQRSLVLQVGRPGQRGAGRERLPAAWLGVGAA